MKILELGCEAGVNLGKINKRNKFIKLHVVNIDNNTRSGDWA